MIEWLFAISLIILIWSIAFKIASKLEDTGVKAKEQAPR
jgi:hypothetical protein